MRDGYEGAIPRTRRATLTPCTCRPGECVAWCSGKPVLPAEHRAGAGDQAQGHPPRGDQHVHEGGAGHPDPGASAGHPVRHLPLEAREPAGGGGVRLLHAHPHALPGGRGCFRPSTAILIVF